VNPTNDRFRNAMKSAPFRAGSFCRNRSISVFRHADVVSREGPNCVLRFPERDHQEMRGIAFDSTQRVSALVARDRAIVGDGNCPHKVEIFVALCRRRTAMPNSSNHVDLAFRSMNC
jgi:hypothetical protein